MASRYTQKDVGKCWDHLIQVLSLGDTIPFAYLKRKQKLSLTEGAGGWGYNNQPSEGTLLDEIRYVLFEKDLAKVCLDLSGKEDGPICHYWRFTFTKKGLVEAYCYHNDD